MKIAITGAMGVGKTTLANDLAEKTGYKVLPEAARIAANKGFKLDKEITPDIEMFIAQLQKDLERDKAPWIADRCFFDLLAYVRVLFPKHWMLQTDIEELLEAAEYDWVLYIPPEFEIEDDGLRSTDVEFQTKIDNEIKELLPDGYVEITGTKEERVKNVLKLIKI